MTAREYQNEYHRRAHEEAKLAYAAFIPCYPFTLENLPGEQWKEIAGFDGYEVSTFGRVKSFHKNKVLILRPAFISEYLQVDLYTSSKKKHCRIHILVARTFIPNPDNKPEVNHDDGHKMKSAEFSAASVTRKRAAPFMI